MTEGSLKTRNLHEVLELAKLTKSERANDQVLNSGLRFVKQIPDLIQLIYQVKIDLHRDQMLLFGTSKAKNSYDFNILAGLAKSNKIKKTILDSKNSLAKNPVRISEYTPLTQTPQSYPVSKKIPANTYIPVKGSAANYDNGGNDAAYQSFKAGLEFFIQGNLHQAIFEFGRVRNIRSLYGSRSLYHHALCNLKTGNHYQAISDFGKYNRDFPHGEHRESSEFYLGNAYENSGNKSAAREQYQKVRQNWPYGSYAQKSQLALSSLNSGYTNYSTVHHTSHSSYCHYGCSIHHHHYYKKRYRLPIKIILGTKHKSRRHRSSRRHYWR
ncbi:tol-pal system YbgF family protein [Candidatus Riflebacteria bacterium]